MNEEYYEVAQIHAYMHDLLLKTHSYWDIMNLSLQGEKIYKVLTYNA